MLLQRSYVKANLPASFTDWTPDAPISACVETFGADVLEPGPMAVVFNGVKGCGFSYQYAAKGYPVPLDDRLFYTDYDFEAYAVPYDYPVARRLTNNFFAGEGPKMADYYAVDWEPWQADFLRGWGIDPDFRRLAPFDDRRLHMVLLGCDFDSPNKKAMTRDAIEAWKKDALDKLRTKLPPGITYASKNGVYAWWRVDLMISEPGEWRAFVSSWHDEIKALTGLEADSKCRGFAHHLRLPKGTRDGVPQGPTADLQGSLSLLDWKMPAGYVAAPKTATKRRPAPSRVGLKAGESSDPNIRWALSNGLAKLIGYDADGTGKYAVYCPCAEPIHNDGALTDSTVVFEGGGFHCFKATHTQEPTYDLWVASLPPKPPLPPADDLFAQIRTALKDPLRGVGSGRAIVLVVPPGVGKTALFNGYTDRNRQKVPGLISRGGLFEGMTGALLVPTTALAAGLQAKSGACMSRGVGAIVEGQPSCTQRRRLEALAVIKPHVHPSLACYRCDDRKTCKVSADFGDKERGHIAVHNLAGKYAEKEIIIVDENPNSALESETIDLSEILPAVEAMAKEWREAVLPFAKWMITGEGDPKLLALDARQAKDTPGTSESLEDTDVCDVPLGSETEYEFFRAKKKASLRKIGIAAAVRRAAEEGAQIDRSEPGKVTIRNVPEVLRSWQKYGGVWAVADPKDYLIKYLRPDAIVIKFDVADGCEGIERIHVKVASDRATANALLKDDQRIEAFVADLTRRVGDIDESDIFIACAKKLLPKVKALLPRAKFATYGGLRGKDEFKGCKAFVSIGENWNEKDSVIEQARFFGVEVDQVWTEEMSGELLQAHGRSRDCRRETSALHLHYGNLEPGGWADRCKVELWGEVANAPKAEVDAARAKARELRSQGMSARKISKELGKSISVTLRYLKGTG